MSLGRRQKNFEVSDRQSLDFLEWAVGENMEVKGATGEKSEGSEEHGGEKCIESSRISRVIGYWSFPVKSIADKGSERIEEHVQGH